jgi:hypothetical protein
VTRKKVNNASISPPVIVRACSSRFYGLLVRTHLAVNFSPQHTSIHRVHGDVQKIAEPGMSLSRDVAFEGCLDVWVH